MKILIVDDEKISRKILVSKMKSLGPCVAVDSSIKAMAEIEMANSADEPFDIITLDVSMPGMDGKQILEHIRRQEIKKKIPKADRVKILMVTSRMNMNTIKACIKLGCNGYLTKPVSRVQLLENLGKMGFDTLAALKEGGAEKSHTAVVADLINRLYFGKVDLPVFPGIVQEVEAHIKGKDPSIEDLAKIVEKDIVISTRLIFIANSPLYKGVETVDSLNAALLRLGLKTARAVITAIAAKALFDTDKNALKTEMARLWLHSFATATLGKHLAEAVGNTKAENIFLMGIVHDIGKMLLMKTFADIYPEDDIADKSLQLAIHEIHTTFGAVLLKRMRFSKAFVQVAEFHHLDRYEKDADQDLVIICLADRLAHEFGFGFMEHQDQGIPGKIKSGLSKDPIENSEDQPGDAPADTREERLERISGFTAIENLGLTPEAVLAIGEKVLPSIKASAQAF